MSRKQEQTLEKEKFSDDYYNIFGEASGADHGVVGEAHEFFNDLPNLGDEAFEAAKLIREFLIEKGFEYDDHIFTLQEMIEKKRGNCLGLSLLIGAELKNRGFSPEYQIILHPKDAIDGEDLRLFKELIAAEHFDFDKPVLPVHQAEYLIYRFAPLEHPSLILGEKRFETTGLEDVEENPGWSPEAELVREVSFEQVASNIYIDRAKTLVNSGKFDIQEVKELALRAVELWPENREAWSFIWEVATDSEDKVLKLKARERYLQIGGDDSRYHFNVYRMTGDKAHLDEALQRFSAYLEPFMIKNVLSLTDEDRAEAKFNFAVAAWCVANSSVYDLNRFYQKYREEKLVLFGEA